MFLLLLAIGTKICAFFSCGWYVGWKCHYIYQSKNLFSKDFRTGTFKLILLSSQCFQMSTAHHIQAFNYSSACALLYIQSTSPKATTVHFLQHFTNWKRKGTQLITLLNATNFAHSTLGTQEYWSPTSSAMLVVIPISLIKLT